jgi:hypothetical protein
MDRDFVRDGGGILLFLQRLKIALKIKDTAKPRPSCQINCSATKGSSATRLRPKN